MQSNNEATNKVRPALDNWWCDRTVEIQRKRVSWSQVSWTCLRCADKAKYVVVRADMMIDLRSPSWKSSWNNLLKRWRRQSLQLRLIQQSWGWTSPWSTSAALQILAPKWCKHSDLGNRTGHKLLPPYIRVIQGDGVDYQSIPKILQRFKDW